MTQTRVDPETDARTVRRRIPAWIAPLLGVAAAAFGLLPWLVRGLRLPLQNLWATPAEPGGMPIALLPFSQYELSLIFAVLVTGSVAAGVAARGLRSRLSPLGIGILLGTTALLQVLAIVQTAVVVRDGLQESTQASFYLVALVAGSVLSLLLGVAAAVLIALAPRAGALVGLTIGAIAASSWIGGFLQPLLVMGSYELLPVVAMLQWVTPVLTGIGIAWARIDTVGRIVSAVVSIVLIWIAPAALTGLSSAAGTRVLASDPNGMIEYGLGVFGMALFIPELALRPVIAAVVVATVGLTLRWLVARRRRDPADPGSA